MSIFDRFVKIKKLGIKSNPYITLGPEQISPGPRTLLAPNEIHRGQWWSIYFIDGKYWLEHDVGSHMSLWRRDEISQAEAEAAMADTSEGTRVLDKIILDLQARLKAQGIDPYEANHKV